MSRKPIVWPSGNFITADLLGQGLTRVSLQNRVKEAIEKKEIRKVGDRRGSKKGPPTRVYVKNNQD